MVNEEMVLDSVKKMKSSGLSSAIISSTLADFGLSPAEVRQYLLKAGFSLTGGEATLWDGKVQREPYPLHFSSLTISAEDLFFPPHDLESTVALQTFVGAGKLPPSGSLKLKGWVNLKEGSFKFGTELRDIDLTTWSPYTAPLPIALSQGRLDLDGEVNVREKQLWGYGLVHVRDLALKRTDATALFENTFGVSQEQLIAFLEGSNGELIFPLKMSGSLTDPRFEPGKMFTSSLRQSLGRTLQKGVGGMFKIGSGTLGVADLEKRAKRVVKEVEKTFRVNFFEKPLDN